MEFVDAHVHFWDPARLDYPWLAGAAGLAGRHAPVELRKQAGELVPEMMVVVEADCRPEHAAGELEWLEGLAAVEPRLRGIVAYCSMNRGSATRERIARLRERPLVKGVRHLVQHESDPAYCLESAFVAGVRALGAAGLSFDLCCVPGQLASVAALVRLCPDTAFVLDHAGKPGLRGGPSDQWRRDVAACADLPNIVCKLSGLVTPAGEGGDTAGELSPVLAHLCETFGAERLVFGSDWPVVNLASSYPGWVRIALALTATLPSQEQRAIFRDNAIRVYRLEA